MSVPIVLKKKLDLQRSAKSINYFPVTSQNRKVNAHFCALVFQVVDLDEYDSELYGDVEDL